MEFEAEGAQPMDVVGEVRVVGEQPIGLGIHAANGAHPLTEAEIPMNTATDWPSAQRSLQAIKIECNNTPDGTSRWREWIQQEVINSSNTSALKRQHRLMARTREQSISQDHMPFLFNILLATLQATDLVSEHPADETLEPEEEDYGHTLNPDEEKGLHFEEFFLEGISAVNIRKRKIASTICSMIAFGRNPSSNGLQLFNSIRFMAGGVSERINAYLHLIGLTSSRQTAIRALERIPTVHCSNRSISPNCRLPHIIKPFAKSPS
ncbi:hypothetical protein PtB15_2B91 [Puccinia triticina]|nr:hypothetical protein PtB15_2B91 [Puccinia triticina]